MRLNFWNIPCPSWPETKTSNRLESRSTLLPRYFLKICSSIIVDRDRSSVWICNRNQFAIFNCNSNHFLNSLPTNEISQRFSFLFFSYIYKKRDCPFRRIRSTRNLFDLWIKLGEIWNNIQQISPRFINRRSRFKHTELSVAKLYR